MIEGKVKNGGLGHKTELWFSLKQFPGVAFEGGFRCGDYQSSPALLTVGSSLSKVLFSCLIWLHLN